MKIIDKINDIRTLKLLKLKGLVFEQIGVFELDEKFLKIKFLYKFYFQKKKYNNSCFF